MTKETTEILETISGKWKLLKGAYLDLRRLGIVTVYNEVFAFGKIWKAFLTFSLIQLTSWKVEKTVMVQVPRSLNSILRMEGWKGDGTINPITWADQDTNLAFLLLTLSTIPRPVLVECKLYVKSIVN